MTADEQRELEIRIKLLEVAGQHCATVSPTPEEVVTRAQTYLAFCDEGRLKAKGTSYVKNPSSMLSSRVG